MNQAIADIDPESEDWEPAWNIDATAMAAWAEFSVTGRAVRYHARFDCLPDDAELEYLYRIWPIGGNEEADGHDLRESRSVASLNAEGKVIDREDGSREVKGYILPEDGCYKRLVWIAIKDGCGGGSNRGGNSNGAGTGSLWWWVSLGNDPFGRPVGNLRVEESSLSDDSYTPRRLRYDGGVNPEVEIIKDEWSSVRQVLAPEVFMDVVVVDDDSYEIRFYPTDGVVPGTEEITVGEEWTYYDHFEDEYVVMDPLTVEVSTGLYTTEAQPFAVWLVENPDGGSTYERLVIRNDGWRGIGPLSV